MRPLKRCRIVKGDAGSFRLGGRHYKVGDIVEVADDFPVEKYSFLQIVQDDIEQYRRPKTLAVKPLMIIMSVRRIPEVSDAFARLDFLDKAYFCNFTPKAISDKINQYLKRHGHKYTHVLISSDDITPSPENIRQLIEDVSIYDLPCVGGWCNICYFDRQDVHGVICGACADEGPHEDANVTFDFVDSTRLTRRSYNFVKVSWAQDHPAIYPVWFQGMACGMVSMKTHRRIPFRSLLDGVGGLMQDLAFAEDCITKGIKQFVDFRVGMRHYGTHHGRLLVGKEPTKIRLKKAKKH